MESESRIAKGNHWIFVGFHRDPYEIDNVLKIPAAEPSLESATPHPTYYSRWSLKFILFLWVPWNSMRIFLTWVPNHLCQKLSKIFYRLYSISTSIWQQQQLLGFRRKFTLHWRRWHIPSPFVNQIFNCPQSFRKNHSVNFRYNE